MRLVLLRCVLGVATLAALACGGDNGDSTATPQPRGTDTPAPEATATSVPAATVESEESYPLRMELTLATSSQPVARWGAYVLDREKQQLWYTGLIGAWSPDSTALARGYCCTGDGEGVDIAEISSGKVTEAATGGDITSLAWSPDSRSLAMVVVTPGVTSPEAALALFVVNRDGSGLRLAAAFESDTRWQQMRWTDQDNVVLEAQTTSESGQAVAAYVRVDVATGEVSHLLTTDPVKADDPRVLFGEPSPGGEWVAFQDNGSYVWNRAGGETTLVDAEGVGGEAWSPDGHQLLYYALREGDRFPFLRLYDVAGGEITDLPDVGLWAQWLPDGRLIHVGWNCASFGAGIAKDVIIEDVLTGAKQAMTHSPDDAEFELFVDAGGKRAVFISPGSSPDRRYRLQMLDLASGSVETIASTNDNSAQPLEVFDQSWSPDGRYLQFFYGGGHGICD